MTNLRTLTVMLAVLGAACQSQDPVATPEPEDGFAIRQHDETTFDATVASGGATLRLQVQQVQHDVVDVTFDFGDPVIGFHIDYTAGLGEFQPSGAPLDAAQSRLVDAMLAEIVKIPSMIGDDKSRVDEVAFRMTSLMQIVPTGEALAAHPIVAAQGWTHISCSCSRQYIGDGYYRTCGRGTWCTGGSGNGCKGRCGTGCSPCVGTAAYTRDCAKHDWGVGSFAAASDDFMFASNNCGC